MGLDGLIKTVKEPYIVEEICNGCGICENVCPLETKAGIEVFAVKNRTPISQLSVMQEAVALRPCT